jgi:hypothetical protein
LHFWFWRDAKIAIVTHAKTLKIGMRLNAIPLFAPHPEHAPQTPSSKTHAEQ